MDRLIGSLLLLVILGATAPAGGQIARGQVVDSLIGAPLIGSLVVLLDSSGLELARTHTDEEGLFLLRAKSPGVYRLRVEAKGFRRSTFPPFTLLDAEMRGYRLLVANLSRIETEPTAEEVIASVCAEDAVRPGQGVLLGIVRNSETQEPVGDAQVMISWPVLDGGLATLAQGELLDDYRVTTASDSNGVYAACGLPPRTELALRALHDELMSDFVRVRFAPEGVLLDGTLHDTYGPIWRQDLELLTASNRTASVTGVVTDSMSQPLSDATVEINDAERTTTTRSDGNFSLTDLPAGTTMLSVRSAGFRPVRFDVDLHRGENAVVPAELLRLDVVPIELEPVTVETDAPVTRRPLADFFERREHSVGSFITRDEFLKQGSPQIATHVLRRMRGVRVDRNPEAASTGQNFLVTMTRGRSRTISGRSDGPVVCPPLFFIDGVYVGNANQVDLDQSISLENIEAVEAHGSTAGLPVEFNRRGSVCGVIAFWTR